MSLLNITIIAALVLTVIALVTGVGAMGQGGEFDDKHADQLMFARVGLQGVTILLLFVAMYLANT